LKAVFFISMRLRPYRFRLTAWAACAVLLAGLFLPVVSMAVVVADSGQGQHWLEVCTADGVRAVTGPHGLGSEGVPDTPPIESVEHCPYCLIYGSADLPRFAQYFFLPRAENEFIAFPVVSQPRVSLRWSPLRSRVPPHIAFA